MKIKELNQLTKWCLSSVVVLLLSTNVCCAVAALDDAVPFDPAVVAAGDENKNSAPDCSVDSNKQKKGKGC